jgi:AcrR family transcriptional regulator
MYHAVHGQMYHAVHLVVNMPQPKPDKEQILDRCLAAFVQAGTLDVSLDHLASSVGMSKRMLIHYFGGRENIEEKTIARLEETLRARFSPDSFPRGVPPKKVVISLWNQTTAPETRGVLLLVMDVARRAWSGSKRARAFYQEQQRLWIQLLLRFLPDPRTVDDVLQLFQGAVLVYLITGDSEPGRRALTSMLSRKRNSRVRLTSRKK